MKDSKLNGRKYLHEVFFGIELNYAFLSFKNLNFYKIIKSKKCHKIYCVIGVN